MAAPAKAIYMVARQAQQFVGVGIFCLVLRFAARRGRGAAQVSPGYRLRYRCQAARTSRSARLGGRHMSTRREHTAIENAAARLAACGVASTAIYFPGFHRSVDNDLLWGTGWTEWDNLRGELNDTVASTAVRQPRRGYYDIWDGSGATLRAQAAEAKRAGIRAFMFYHYWFAHGRTALSRPLEDALLDSGGEHAAAAAAAAVNRRGNRPLEDFGVSLQERKRRAKSLQKRANSVAAATPTKPQPLPGIGLPFFFSWANEPWERRAKETGAFKGDPTAVDQSSSPRVNLIRQDYGTRTDWEAHFEWMLRFFKHPDYVRVKGAPLVVLYDATDFDADSFVYTWDPRVNRTRISRREPSEPKAGTTNHITNQSRSMLKSCIDSSIDERPSFSISNTCGGRPTPLGCAAGEQYLLWYPHLASFLTPDKAYAFHTMLGERLGFVWPRSHPCLPMGTQNEALLPQMLATWQALARARGLANGLHILLTMNHQWRSAPAFHSGLLSGRKKVGGTSIDVQGMVQFLPTSLVSQPFMTGTLGHRGWPWGARGNFYWGLVRECYREEMRMPSNQSLTMLKPPRGWRMSCECLLRHVASDDVDQRYTNAVKAAGGRSTQFVRGAFASWSNYPRKKHMGAAYCRSPKAESFRFLVEKQLTRALSDAGGAAACAVTARNATASANAAWRHLLLINSWNEWGEQAAIEPSLQDGEALLDAHREALMSVSRTVEAGGSQ